MSSLVFIDSFDHYSSAQGSRKWTVFPGGTIGSGRTGNALTAGGGSMPSKTLGQEYATLTAGVAYTTQGFANPILIFTNADDQLTFTLQHVGDGRLRFHVGIGFSWSYDSPPSTFVMSANRWYYVELQVNVTGSPPHFTATARINEDPIMTLDQTSTTSGAVKFAAVGLNAPGTGLTATVDDFYCTDDEFLGDVKIGVLYPNAIGDSSGWTPNVGGSPNFLNVLEHPADDDATYVSAATVGLKDLYNLDDIGSGFTGVIKGAQALWLTKKSDAGAGGVKGVWKSGSTELDQASGLNFFLPNGFDPSMFDYMYSIEPERKSLFTASDWTVSEIDALQLGIKRTA